MSRTGRLFVLVTLAIVLFAARTVTPVPRVAAGAFGRGSTVVIVPGLASGPRDWMPVARILARDHRVVLVDLPGHGQSPMPSPFDLDAAVAALDGALAAERRPVLLVGHSLGGLVAAAEACAHPDRVRGLVLVETALEPPDSDARAVMLGRLERDYPGLVRDAYLDFGRDRAQGQQLWAAARAMSPDVMRPWIRLALTTDLSNDVAYLPMPVTAVLAPRSWPEGEPWGDAARALGCARIPRLEGVRVEGCGHFIMLDRPDTLAAIIARAAVPPPSTVLALR